MDTAMQILQITVILAIIASCRSGKVDWPTVASCGPSSSDVVASVSRVLLDDGDSSNTTISDRAVHELEGFAADHGAGLVACLVDDLIRSWSRPGAALTPHRIAATARGRDFLSRVAHTSVIRREP